MRTQSDTYVAGVHLSAGATVENDRDDREAKSCEYEANRVAH